MDYQILFLKYMRHLLQVDDSLALELLNTPFSNVRFTSDEILALREMEVMAETSEDPASLVGLIPE